MTNNALDKRKLFVLLWPVFALLSVFIPIPLHPFIFALVLGGIASWLVIKSAVAARIKVIVIAAWCLAIGCVTYAIAAFGAMVDAADLGAADPAWTKGLVPLVVIGMLIFVAVDILLYKIPTTWNPSAKSLDGAF